jgi:hypothetical protein
MKDLGTGGEAAAARNRAENAGMNDEWDVVKGERGWPSGATGMGILRITLLFGSAAVALALIIAPIADSQTRSYADADRPFGVDDIATGSIAKGGSVYTIHKSVLQPSPESICVIRSNGQRIGDC